MDKKTNKTNTDKVQDGNEGLLHDFKSSGDASFFSTKRLIIAALAILLGIGSGFVLSQNGTKGSTTVSKNGATSTEKGSIVGSVDSKTFKDTAEGVLQQGGIDGEGQYHLVRPGGDSQNVYLTSSIVDLSQFVEKKIKVWGETQKAQSAGWLMDVGKVEVLE